MDKTDFVVTPYRICAAIFIQRYSATRTQLSPRANGKLCMFILDLIKQNEYSFKQLNELIDINCDMGCLIIHYRHFIDKVIEDINNLFERVKQMRDSPDIDSNSVAGLHLRKISIHFDRLTHQAISRLFDELTSYVMTVFPKVRRSYLTPNWAQTKRLTRSKNLSFKDIKPTYHMNHELAKLQANEIEAMSPKDLYEYLRRPNNSCKSDAIFLRYLNLLRTNECVASKQLLMAYFDMVSDTVPRSYSALNYAVWYLHHGEYRRSIECLQECYCCAQAADDDKCLLIALMWLARIVIQSRQKNSTKYNVMALLELVKRRSHKAGMPYVQAMASMALNQLHGPRDDSEILKKSSATLKQVALNSRHHNHILVGASQPSPLDKDDELPSAEILAVRNSMNDVLAMYYALLSAHLNLSDASQSSALASQTLLHLDLIEKCGNEDIFLLNENIFIALRNICFHIWNLTRDIKLVREILVDLCSNYIPPHRTDYHSIWRRALAEISFEYYMEQDNWSEANKMIDLIQETDHDGSQLRMSELYRKMGAIDEALQLVDDLIVRIEREEIDLSDPAALSFDNQEQNLGPYPSQSMEHKSYIKAKALLLQATLLSDETKLLECLNYATDNGFVHIRTACLMQLAKQVNRADAIMEDIVVEVFANGTRVEKQELRAMLNDSNEIDH